MKKVFLSLLMAFIFFTGNSQVSLSYNLSNKEQTFIDQIDKKLDEIQEEKSQQWFESRIKKIEKIIPTLPKLRYKILFVEIKNSFQKTLDKKQENIILKEDMELEEYIPLYSEEYAKEEIIPQNNGEKLSSNDFFLAHGQNIVGDLTPDIKCREKYDFIDEIAQREDFPTELILATWSIETNCNMSNPANTWGLFQITSGYFEPGNVGLIELENQVINFINFSRNKWDYFNNNTYHNLKQRFGSENIHISYNHYTLRDLQLHSILYNGIGANTTLEGNTFANNNLNSNVIGSYDGVVTRFLKLLYWKANN